MIEAIENLHTLVSYLPNIGLAVLVMVLGVIVITARRRE